MAVNKSRTTNESVPGAISLRIEKQEIAAQEQQCFNKR
jgi:hypothetical protein